MDSVVPSRLLYAAGSTAVAGLFFGLVGDINRFPFREVGFCAFLVLVFGVALALYGRVD
jgi:hypothetical protein